jgi:hypothetical protein
MRLRSEFPPVQANTATPQGAGQSIAASISAGFWSLQQPEE